LKLQTQPIPGVIFGSRAALRKRIDNVILLGVPLFGGIAAVAHASRFGVTTITAGAFLLFYAWTALGGTLGLHRYFSHRSFKASPPVAILLAMGACFTMQGSIVRWVADHRRHHRLEDQAGDPHSPAITAAGEKLSRIRGLIHAHYTWMLDANVSDPQHFCPELFRDRLVMHFQRFFWFYVLLSLALPAMMGWILGGVHEGVRCLLWAGCVRVLLIQQATFTINSMGHSFGRQDFPTRDSSRNLWPFSILLLGDGYHNTHHAFPRSARIALLPGQLDPGHALLRWLEKGGLVFDIVVPSASAVAAKRRQSHPETETQP
jgi:stearoyl-CoA desaturase (delta-9 desaturase)